MRMRILTSRDNAKLVSHFVSLKGWLIKSKTETRKKKGHALAYPLGVLSLWWEEISPMGILVADLPVWTVDDQLRSLIPGNISSNGDGFSLCGRTDGSAAITYAFHLPSPAGVRRDMLVLTQSNYLHYLFKDFA